MTEATPHQPNLPETLEDQVLEILEGDETAQEPALRGLLDDNPEHARTIRAWLTKAGVPLPNVVTTGGTTVEGGDLEHLPQQLGRYRLIEKLGRGGFGTVFRAEQQEPFVRQVAIKVLNPGMDSREVLARFSAEREALNRMDHPGIARLLDAGTTPQGRPFFVMELVEGPSLATLCRQRSLPMRARLELFSSVLDAMQHAHQKAVLHRDLSSNNVLVTEIDGELQPKIIDFGIAKSLADPLLDGGAMTFQGTLLGTPEFMSPEQAAGEVSDIDTRADVYALGVQLYELLTDQLPIPSHILRAQGIAGMAQVIRDHEPLLPSVAAVKRARGHVRRDLDAIVGRAIAKRRDDRYATVAELAADIRSFLRDEPITAAEPSDWYRFRKFVRRNRAESAVIAVVTLGLIGATGMLWWALSIKSEALAESESQKQEIARRADGGFLLLANEERLIDARAAAAVLPPAWPEHESAYREWLADHGVPLQEEVPKLSDKIAELERDGLAEIADKHLHSALQRLEVDLAGFVDGTLARVRGRFDHLNERVRPQLQRLGPTWQRTIEEVRQAYRGVTLAPMPGLVPLGPDPNSGLHEFLDLASHAADTPFPERDEATGQLSCAADTGVIFVLVPAGRFRIGAVRDRPGLSYYDPDARDDELDGQSIHLDDFLIARCELTRAQAAALTGSTLPTEAEARLPLTGIDWHGARELLRQHGLDLPTEAQWEYSCRATTKTPWSTGKSIGPKQAWLGVDRPQPVATSTVNAYGLYDCHGNVAEWCRDEKLSYEAYAPRSGDGLRRHQDDAKVTARVVRGGDCFRKALVARSSARDSRAPDIRDSSIGVRPIRRLR